VAKRPAKKTVYVGVADSFAAVDRLMPDWRALFEESRTHNPFTNPTWLRAWMLHFTREPELWVMEVRQSDRLIGVAPFYRRRFAGGVRRVRLVGMGHDRTLTELPQVLAAPGMERQVLRAVVAELMARAGDWDWVDLSLPPEQGWFEPDWLSGRDAQGSFSTQVGTFACVVMPLPDSPNALQAALKRNVRESVRQSHNRLRRASADIRFEKVDGGGGSVRKAVRDLSRLHSARARMRDKPQHENLFPTALQEVFVQSVTQELAGTGHANVALLKADRVPIAAVLLLRANGGVFFSASGMSPDWWDHGPMTFLQAECLRGAIADGDRFANLSIGPDVSKLRWSEVLELHNHFVIVGPRLRSKAAFAAYTPFRSAAVIAQLASQGR
jgi:hypothetical protein